jgi:hypothetical protein
MPRIVVHFVFRKIATDPSAGPATLLAYLLMWLSAGCHQIWPVVLRHAMPIRRDLCP